MILNVDIVGIEEPYDEFSVLFYTYQSFVLNIQDLHK